MMPGCVSLHSGNQCIEAFLVSVASLVYVLLYVISLLLAVFDLWLLYILLFPRLRAHLDLRKKKDYSYLS